MIAIENLDEINRTFRKLDAALKQDIAAELAQNVYEGTQRKADAHTKTGAMFRSVYMHRAGIGYEIGTDRGIAPYAIFVHFGTKKHTIAPKNKKAPRWVDGTITRFAKSVKHPGYKGDPFLYNAAKEEFAKIDEIFRRITNDI